MTSKLLDAVDIEALHEAGFELRAADWRGTREVWAHALDGRRGALVVAEARDLTVLVTEDLEARLAGVFPTVAEALADFRTLALGMGLSGEAALDGLQPPVPLDPELFSNGAAANKGIDWDAVEAWLDRVKRS